MDARRFWLLEGPAFVVAVLLLGGGILLAGYLLAALFGR